MTDQTTPQSLTPDLVNAIVRDMNDSRYPTRITVFCDHCGVEDTGEYMVREGMTSAERLAVARWHLVENGGWEHTAEGDDFCPVHAAPAAKEQPGEAYVQPADRPAEWAEMAHSFARDGFGADEIAAMLCVDTSAVAQLLEGGAQ